MKKKILILCCGNPFACDMGFGPHVFKVLEKMGLPPNVEMMEVGFSACMVPHIMETKDEMIIVDVLHTNDAPGTVLRLTPEEVPLMVKGKTDPAKSQLVDTIDQLMKKVIIIDQAILQGQQQLDLQLCIGIFL